MWKNAGKLRRMARRGGDCSASGELSTSLDNFTGPCAWHVQQHWDLSSWRFLVIIGGFSYTVKSQPGVLPIGAPEKEPS
jgi:hypothetical protein